MSVIIANIAIMQQASQDLRHRTAPSSPSATRTLRYWYLVGEIAQNLLAQRPRMVEIEDIYQLGFLGLLEADQQYEGPAEGFSKYAHARIRAAMLTDVPDGDMGSRRLQRMVRQMHKSSQWLEQSLGRAPKPIEFANASGLTLKAYQDVVRESHVLRKRPGKPAMKRSRIFARGHSQTPCNSPCSAAKCAA
jgi:DNA-directed RNA polymerase specialized sigma subunit